MGHSGLSKRPLAWNEAAVLLVLSNVNLEPGWIKLQVPEPASWNLQVENRQVVLVRG